MKELPDCKIMFMCCVALRFNLTSIPFLVVHPLRKCSTWDDVPD